MDDDIDIVFDPCDSLTLQAVGASADQVDSIEHAADIWAEVGAQTALAADIPDPEAHDDGEVLPIRFERSAPMFFGIYRDELGDVVINKTVTNAHRAVVIAHEIGHAFGLEHVTGRDSVMNKGNVSLLPNDEDVEALMRLWPDCTL